MCSFRLRVTLLRCVCVVCIALQSTGPHTSVPCPVCRAKHHDSRGLRKTPVSVSLKEATELLGTLGGVEQR